jgi:hypothetical protein
LLLVGLPNLRPAKGQLAKGPVAGAVAVLSEERFALMRAYYAVPDPALRHALCEIFQIHGASHDRSGQ